MCLVTFDHEALGHGGMCLALGGHIHLLTSSIFRCDIRSVWIAPAGPFGNLLGGTLALLFVRLVPRRSAHVRLLLILVAGFAFWPDAAVARRVARTAWVAATIGAILAAASSGEGRTGLRDATLEIGAGSFPWLFIPRQGRAQSDAHAPAPIRIEYNRRMIVVSLIVFVVFVATLGRGVRF
jgi:hypothetical protein